MNMAPRPFSVVVAVTHPEGVVEELVEDSSGNYVEYIRNVQEMLFWQVLVEHWVTMHRSGN